MSEEAKRRALSEMEFDLVESERLGRLAGELIEIAGRYNATPAEIREALALLRLVREGWRFCPWFVGQFRIQKPDETWLWDGVAVGLYRSLSEAIAAAERERGEQE